jgi:hypothetical protein
MKRAFIIFTFCAALTSAAQAQTTLQQAVQDAPHGAVVYVPAGVYTGQVVLKDGVFLVAKEGAEKTVIDGGGLPIAVIGGHQSALIGFTVRNAPAAFRNGGRFSGIFECRIESEVGITGGSSVLANNVIAGTGASTGVAVYGSNPFVVNNIIRDHAVGLRTTGHLAPYLEGNAFVHNDLAVLVDTGSVIRLAGNRYFGNQADVTGASLGATDAIVTADPGSALPYRSGDIEAYRRLMAIVSAQQFEEHPAVVYLLGDTLGEFDVVTLYPWATFTVGASAPDTVVATHRALDTITGGRIRSSLRVQDRAWVDCMNPEVRDRGDERFACEKRFIHPASYTTNEVGRRVFTRLTTMTRVEVVLPAGQIPVEVSHGNATFTRDGGRWTVRTVNPLITNIRIVMENEAGSADPLGLRKRAATIGP